MQILLRFSELMDEIKFFPNKNYLQTLMQTHWMALKVSFREVLIIFLHEFNLKLKAKQFLQNLYYGKVMSTTSISWIISNVKLLYILILYLLSKVNKKSISKIRFQSPQHLSDINPSAKEISLFQNPFRRPRTSFHLTFHQKWLICHVNDKPRGKHWEESNRILQISSKQWLCSIKIICSSV